MDLVARAASIRGDSDALADAASGNLDTAVPSCPGWVMADLVEHILQVHRSWYRIVDEQIMEPDWSSEPMPARDALVDEFRANAHRFADLLAHTDPDSPCWTWGPSQTAGFVQRFQVQEAALHRWDAESAVGEPAPLGTEGAADAIVLFADILPMATKDPAHAFAVEVLDHPDGRRTVPMLHDADRPVAGTLRGPASDLLLVLWQRRPVATVEVDGDRAAIQATIDAADFG